MSYLYDLEPGVCVATEEPLDVETLDKARADYASGAAARKVAKALGGRLHEPERAPTVRVAVDEAELERLLKKQFPDKAERERVLEQLAGRG